MVEPPDQAAPAPRIKITRLHIEGYRSLRRVRWPEDGLGWGDAVPDTVLVGGLNGSGKTTLLELIFGVVRFLVAPLRGTYLHEDVSEFLPRGSQRIELHVSLDGDACALEIDAEGLHSLAQGGRQIVIERRTTSGVTLLGPSETIQKLRALLASRFLEPKAPRLIYFPTDRAVPFPETDFKGSGYRPKRSADPVYRYFPPHDWNRSVEAILYDARWRDLNAREQGRPNPGHFAAFERVMQRFLAGEKQFMWDDEGVLHVRTKDGALHPLEALSSGEKQVLLFAAELVERWTPGSLVLIDEPELHLHEAWLAALWTLIGELQRERGGQVIVATQSNYLWGLGGLGTHVLLGGWKS